MKKILTIAAGAAILAVAAMSPANAQGKANGPFADVPTDNWAYQSVEKLRDAGIVIGYPDGTYAGKRALTRYEFATAIARLLALLPSGSTDTSAYVTKDQLADALAKVNTGTSAAPAGDTSANAEVVKRLENNEGAITAVKGLVQEFGPELKSLGVSQADINAKLAALDKRVSALEEEVNRVKITGSINYIGRSDIATKTQSGKTLYAAGIDKDGVLISPASKSLYNNPQIYNDIVLGITGKVSDDATAVIALDYGTYFGYLQSAGQGETAAGAPALNLYEGYLNTPSSIPGIITGTAKIGQFGTQLTPLVFSLNAPEVYSNIDWEYNGNLLVSGVQETGAIANVIGAQLFAGKASGGDTNMGIKVTPGYGWTGTRGNNYSYIDNVAGARLTYAVNNWTIGYNYVIGRIDANGTALPTYNSLKPTTTDVWGFDLAGKVADKLGLTAEVAVDQTGLNSTFATVNKSKDNAAFDVFLTDTFGSVNAKLGYRAIQALYGAPGQWIELGSIIDPTNIQGGELTLSDTFSSQWSGSIEGAIYSGIKNAGADGSATITGLGKKDSLDYVNASVTYGFAPTYKLNLGYEYLAFDLKGSSNSNPDSFAKGKPTESFVNVGINHDVNKNAAVSVLYQILAYNDKNSGLFAADAATDRKSVV